ncbi:MAG: SoxR reducing system RseC family protein [Bacteroidales bacterium]|nr:SoxR reducing system RseC family protein [Bacteroidales bacterium]
MSIIITHTGYIKKITPNKIIVGVKNIEACSTCNVAYNCTLNENPKEREIEIYDKNISDFKVNDKVIIKIYQKNAWQAMLLVYIVPIIFFVSTYFIVLNITGNDLISGFFSFLFLIIYFFCIYAFRRKINKKITFEIKKI